MSSEGTPREGRPFPDPEHSITPRRPRTVGGVVYLGVLAATGVGLTLVATGPWRLGLGVIGGSLLFGALLRLVIPNGSAGMLGMRPKLVDVMALLVLGTGLVVLAGVIPNRPAL